MKSARNIITSIIITATTVGWLSCSKSSVAPAAVYNLSYGDSVFYLRPQSNDYVVSPVEVRPGTYKGFPEGIEIDDRTGAINVSKSEMGLRYLITHTAPDGTKTQTMLVLSGITFFDKYYNLSQDDSVAFPVYNASASNSLPLSGSIFDDGGGANASGCSVQTINGQINLSKSIREGVFGNNPKNDDRTDIEIVYRLNDNSNKAVNKLKVRLYYYETMSDVAPDLLETLQERTDQGVFLRGNELNTATGQLNLNGTAKPRPPCIVIIAN